MTLTLELPPEIEEQLRTKAAKAGQDVGTYVAHILASTAASNESGEAARLAAIRSLRGKYAELGISSEDITRERQKDMKREERFARRLSAESED